MSIFGIFKKKKGGSTETALEKHVRELKCRKISLVDTDLDELAADMQCDPQSVMKLTPVNYYAVKNEYILALVYMSADYSEAYVKFKRVAYEKVTGETGLFQLDKHTLARFLAKVGIMINVDADKADASENSAP